MLYIFSKNRLKIVENQKYISKEMILKGVSEQTKKVIMKSKPNVIFRHKNVIGYVQNGKLIVNSNENVWGKVKSKLKLLNNKSITQTNTNVTKIKFVIPQKFMTAIIQSLFKPECHEMSGVFVMKKKGNVYRVTKIVKQHYSKDAVYINTLNKSNNEFSSFHTHPLSCLDQPGYKCVMGWPSQADFTLCFIRSLGMGIKENREAFTLVFTHEGYYILQVHNTLVKALRGLSYAELNEIAQGIDKTIDSYQIEERRVAKPNPTIQRKHAYSTAIITKKKKLLELKTMLGKVTFQKVLKNVKNNEKYLYLCKNNNIQVFFIHFVSYNDHYDSRKNLNKSGLRGGKSLQIRESVIF